jgi:hypothetical protein
LARALLAHVCTRPDTPVPDAWLRACAVQDEAQWLVAAAEMTMLGGVLWAALTADQRRQLPPAPRQRLADLHLGNALRWETHRRLIATYLPPLQEAGIPVAVLKGTPLTLTVYRDPAERTMCDLDLLVPEARLAEAHGLLSAGAARVRRSVRGHRHLGAIRMPGEAGMLELHGSEAHAQSWPRTGDLLAEGIPVLVEGVEVRVPGPVDLWLHVACHSLVHEPDCWPRMAADLSRLQAQPGWNEAAWQHVWGAATRARRRRAVLMAAAMAAGASVPPALATIGATAAEVTEAEGRAQLAWRAAWTLPHGRWGPWPRLWALDGPDQRPAIWRHALPPLGVLADANALPSAVAAAAYPGYVLWRCFSLASTGLAWSRALRACRPPRGTVP